MADVKQFDLYMIDVERMWRSLKHEDLDLKSYENIRELKQGLHRYFRFYNSKIFHQSLDYLTPEEMYQSFQTENKGLAA